MREILAAALWLVRSPFAAFQAVLASRPLRVVSRIVLLGRAPVNAALLAATIPVLQKEGMFDIRLPRPILILAAPLLALGEWLFNTALLSAVARLAGSKARLIDTLLVYGYAQAPYLFVRPALLFPFSILQLAVLFANGWSLILLFLGVLLSHGLGRGRTFLVLLASQLVIPFLLGMAVFVR